MNIVNKKKKLPKIGLLYLDYVLRFFDKSNFKGWPDKIETVVYHWGNDKARFINEVRRKEIDVLIGNIPATAYETFKEIAAALPNVRFIPSIETQFANKSKENVTLFCKKHDLSIPHTEIFYDKEEGYEYLKTCKYPQIIKRSYGPSNYGGYYVHKVDSYEEAVALLEEKKYMPIYTQDAIPLKYSGDIRVMLIGHKPVCAFWRFSGEGQWITNTSQGGSMSYENVPMSALELAVEASKAAKAEYWACDIAIDENTDKPYILECATAFAAFPYIRDWIGQYLMWDLSEGRFPLPHVPLYSWEELGKISPSLLRTMRHIHFAKYTPSADGAYWLEDKGEFDMEKTEESTPDDIPEPIKPEDEEKIPEIVKESVKEEAEIGPDEQEQYDLQNITLTQLLTLQGMQEDVAVKIKELVDNKEISSLEDLSKYDFVSKEQIYQWSKYFKK